MSSDRNNYVFVYGTLRPVDVFDNYIDATHMLYRHKIHNVLGKFPAMAVSEEGSSVVYGNIIRVDDAGLAELDRYEGVQEGMYERVYVTEWLAKVGCVWDLPGADVSAYLGKGIFDSYKELPVIEGGDWANA